jgi:hypothetical protein
MGVSSTFNWNSPDAYPDSGTRTIRGTTYMPEYRPGLRSYVRARRWMTVDCDPATVVVLVEMETRSPAPPLTANQVGRLRSS